MKWFEGGDKPFTVAQLKEWLAEMPDDQLLELQGDYMENGYLQTAVPRPEHTPDDFTNSTLSTLSKVTKEIYESGVREQLATDMVLMNMKKMKAEKGQDKYATFPIVKERD